jgi:hypothetical protein
MISFTQIPELIQTLQMAVNDKFFLAVNVLKSWMHFKTESGVATWIIKSEKVRIEDIQ